MKCPFCHQEELKVIDSRNMAEVNGIRRRRECLSCGRRFTSFETVELMVQVQKRGGYYQDFDQKKLIAGLQAACSHTRVSHSRILQLAQEIKNIVMERHSRSISTTDLGELVMQQLQKLDPIAYIRFACVYRRFKKLDELQDALGAIKSKDDHSADESPQVEKINT